MAYNFFSIQPKMGTFMGTNTFTYPNVVKAGSGSIDVHGKFKWKNHGSVEEVPCLVVTEYSLDYGLLTTSITRLLQPINSALSMGKDPGQVLYTGNPTGFSYNLPYLKSEGSIRGAISNGWVKQDGLMDIIGSSLGGIGKMIKRAGDTFDKIGKVLTPGWGREDIKRFGQTEEKSISVSFPLYNTGTVQEANDNYSFISLFAIQNLKTRTSFTTYLPPKIYTLDTMAEGGIFCPAAYVKSFDVEAIGPVRRMNDFGVGNAAGAGSSGYRLVPEAYLVKIVFGELLPESSNIMEGALGGSKVKVISSMASTAGTSFASTFSNSSNSNPSNDVLPTDSSGGVGPNPIDMGEGFTDRVSSGVSINARQDDGDVIYPLGPPNNYSTEFELSGESIAEVYGPTAPVGLPDERFNGDPSKNLENFIPNPDGTPMDRTQMEEALAAQQFASAVGEEPTGLEPLPTPDTITNSETSDITQGKYVPDPLKCDTGLDASSGEEYGASVQGEKQSTNYPTPSSNNNSGEEWSGRDGPVQPQRYVQDPDAAEGPIGPPAPPEAKVDPMWNQASPTPEIPKVDPSTLAKDPAELPRPLSAPDWSKPPEKLVTQDYPGRSLAELAAGNYKDMSFQEEQAVMKDMQGAADVQMKSEQANLDALNAQSNARVSAAYDKMTPEQKANLSDEAKFVVAEAKHSSVDALFPPTGAPGSSPATVPPSVVTNVPVANKEPDLTPVRPPGASTSTTSYDNKVAAIKAQIDAETKAFATPNPNIVGVVSIPYSKTGSTTYQTTADQKAQYDTIQQNYQSNISSGMSPADATAKKNADLRVYEYQNFIKPLRTQQTTTRNQALGQ